MDDDSDDGNWKGESQFIKDENRIDNFEDFDNGNNDNEYNENYTSNYNRKIDDAYEDKKYEDNNDSQDYKSNNNYYYDDDYEYYDDYDYDENNNDEYNYKYNYNNIPYNNNYYRNDHHNNNYNRQYRNNYNRRYRYRPIFRARERGASIKTKEFYFSEFMIKFKLWLLIVLKISEKSKIKFIEDEKINDEIYESFINLYNYKKDKNESSNNLNIEIEKIEIRKIVQNNYNIEFNIIITEELKVYFIKKYINIKVTGVVDNIKYPKFYFQLKQYKLELNDESKVYYNKEKDNTIIIKKEINEEVNKDKLFMIGMQPNYSIENKKFRKYFEELQRNDSEEYNDDKENKKKGPQEEIIDIFFELNEILNKEKKTGNSSNY